MDSTTMIYSIMLGLSLIFLIFAIIRTILLKKILGAIKMLQLGKIPEVKEKKKGFDAKEARRLADLEKAKKMIAELEAAAPKEE